METAQVLPSETVRPLERKEKRESREVIANAMNTVHSFWDEFYDNHKDTLTPDQKKEFALFNMGVLRTGGGEKRSFGVLNGKVKQGPMVSGAISFAREQAATMKDSAKQEELLIAAKVLEMNSAPYFRTENRREHKGELITSLAFDLAAATEGSHEHAMTYAQAAEDMLSNQLELVLPTDPTPDALPARRAIRTSILPEKTLAGALEVLTTTVDKSKKRFGRTIAREPLRQKAPTLLTNPTAVDMARAREDAKIADLKAERLLVEQIMHEQSEPANPEASAVASLEPTAAELLQRMRESTAQLTTHNDQNEAAAQTVTSVLPEQVPAETVTETHSFPIVETPAPQTVPEVQQPEPAPLLIQTEPVSKEIVTHQPRSVDTVTAPAPADYLEYHKKSLGLEANQMGSSRSLVFPETNPVRESVPDLIPPKSGMRQIVSGLLQRFGRRKAA